MPITGRSRESLDITALKWQKSRAHGHRLARFHRFYALYTMGGRTILLSNPNGWSRWISKPSQGYGISYVTSQFGCCYCWFFASNSFDLFYSRCKKREISNRPLEIRTSRFFSAKIVNKSWRHKKPSPEPRSGWEVHRSHPMGLLHRLLDRSIV